jgi:manganese efflux pump family protein
MGIRPMTFAALITWFATAAGGICLLAIWLVEYDHKDAATRLPRTVVSAHALLALAGLVVWSAYLTSDASRLAWIAVAILAVVTVLGLTMAVRWIGVYRAHQAPSAAVLVPAGARGTGPEPPAPVPPERNLPVPVVIAHGVLAATTVVLVILTALDVGGS